MRSSRTITNTECANIIAWIAAGITASEQAKRLGMAYANFCRMRQRMAGKGQLQLAPRPPWRSWTRQELDKLSTLLEQGLSYEEIARRLKRTFASITLMCRRHSLGLMKAGGVLTARQVANLLGVRCAKTVTRWITKWGWLVARNAGTPEKKLWRIQEEDLLTFLENDQAWMAWHPERITDWALREWAQELRAGKPRWLTPSEVAGRLHVDRFVPQSWIEKGLLSSFKYGNHWIREDQLEGFVIPIERILQYDPQICPTCGQLRKSQRALTVHRTHKHGYRKAV